VNAVHPDCLAESPLRFALDTEVADALLPALPGEHVKALADEWRPPAARACPAARRHPAEAASQELKLQFRGMMLLEIPGIWRLGRFGRLRRHLMNVRHGPAFTYGVCGVFVH
jgi:hypothetical protein